MNTIPKQLTEEATTDHPEQALKKLAHFKTFYFFVFYDKQLTDHLQLQKICFSMKDERQRIHQKGQDNKKQVQMQFYNIDNQIQQMQGLNDLKQANSQSKLKLVAFCSQSKLLNLLDKSYRLEIDISSIPVILARVNPNSDLSIFSGWSEEQVCLFKTMSIGQIQKSCRKWIQASQQKVDIWCVNFKKLQQGKIEKLNGQIYEDLIVQSSFQQYFLSHLTLGYHAKLSSKFQQKKKDQSHRNTNFLLYSWQRFKNFCCVGSQNLKRSTGVISIDCKTDKGQSVQILKHLRQYDGSQSSQAQASKVIKSDKGILSLVVSNIDRIHGQKYETGGKPGDSKLQIGVFEGATIWRKIVSVSGELLIKIQGNGTGIDIQVGDNIYRCYGNWQLKIKQYAKSKIAINREVLQC